MRLYFNPCGYDAVRISTIDISSKKLLVVGVQETSFTGLKVITGQSISGGLTPFSTFIFGLKIIWHLLLDRRVFVCFLLQHDRFLEFKRLIFGMPAHRIAFRAFCLCGGWWNSFQPKFMNCMIPCILDPGRYFLRPSPVFFKEPVHLITMDNLRYFTVCNTKQNPDRRQGRRYLLD